MKAILRGSNIALLIGMFMVLSSCQSIKEIAALRDVAFAIDRLTDVRLAGIDLSQVRSVRDLRAADVLNLTRALNRREMPLTFQLNLEATNPSTNSVAARLVGLDWTLFLEEKETISGAFNGDVTLPPGQPQQVPFGVSLDLVQFFEGGVNDLVNVAQM